MNNYCAYLNGIIRILGYKRSYLMSEFMATGYYKNIKIHYNTQECVITLITKGDYIGLDNRYVRIYDPRRALYYLRTYIDKK